MTPSVNTYIVRLIYCNDNMSLVRLSLDQMANLLETVLDLEGLEEEMEIDKDKGLELFDRLYDKHTGIVDKTAEEEGKFDTMFDVLKHKRHVALKDLVEYVDDKEKLMYVAYCFGVTHGIGGMVHAMANPVNLIKTCKDIEDLPYDVEVANETKGAHDCSDCDLEGDCLLQEKVKEAKDKNSTRYIH